MNQEKETCLEHESWNEKAECHLVPPQLFCCHEVENTELFGVMEKSNGPKKQSTVSIRVPGSSPKHTGPIEDLLSCGDIYIKIGDIREKGVVLNYH